MSSYLQYPGICARCGQRWGDHYHNPKHSCKFYPMPGEPDKPIRIQMPEVCELTSNTVNGTKGRDNENQA